MSNNSWIFWNPTFLWPLWTVQEILSDCFFRYHGDLKFCFQRTDLRHRMVEVQAQSLLLFQHLKILRRYFNLWLWKTLTFWTSPWMSQHLKSDSRKEYFRLGLPCEVVFSPKSWKPAENVNMPKPVWAWKPGLVCTSPWPQKISHLFKIWNSHPWPHHHIKRQPYASMPEKRLVLLDITQFVTHPEVEREIWWLM